MNADIASSMPLFIGIGVLFVLVVLANFFTNISLRSASNMEDTVVNLSSKLVMADKQISQLEITLQSIQRETQIKLDQAEYRLADLTRQLQAAQERIRQLEMELEARDKTANLADKDGHLLVVFGPDQTIVDRDRHALRRSRVPFDRLLNATRDDLASELDQRRLNGEPVQNLHIASHGGPDGIVLCSKDGGSDVVPPDWWHENLDGVLTVMLATCSGTEIANELGGLVDDVIFFREGVDNQKAADFIGQFWKGIEEGRSAEVSYKEAKVAVPAVQEFVAIRHRRRK